VAEQNPKDNPWRAAALTTAVGVDLAVCLFGGYWIGGTLGGNSLLWQLLGLGLGLVVAVVTIYFLIKKTGGF
jgi:hypothetical protein